MILKGAVDTMTTKGTSHNDNGFATSYVRILDSGTVRVPEQYEQWLRLEMAMKSENRKYELRSKTRALAQFKSYIWSDHKPIYIDVVLKH